jgi:UDP-N-acetylglucosamine acyltransferase
VAQQAATSLGANLLSQLFGLGNTGNAVLGASVNLLGLRRSGASRETIETTRWVFKALYRSGCAPQQAMPLLEARAGDPVVDEYIAFIRASKRGICHGTGRARRGHAAIDVD